MCYCAHTSGTPELTWHDSEIQLFLLGYILISICEIFSVGEFPLNKTVRVVRLPVPMAMMLDHG